MLEARLLVKLAKAQGYCESGRFNLYRQSLCEALAMATDTEWEDAITVIVPDEEIIKRACESHKKDDSEVRHMVPEVDDILESLCTAIGDKVHRRNLQIADLKRDIAKLERNIQVTKGPKYIKTD